MDPDEIVTIHGDPWKWRDIAESVDWCRSRQWKREHWKPPRLSKSSGGISPHEHCEICWWTLAESPESEDGIGYTDGYRWICTECHDRFIQQPHRTI